jgi:hypothetical protein
LSVMEAGLREHLAQRDDYSWMLRDFTMIFLQIITSLSETPISSKISYRSSLWLLPTPMMYLSCTNSRIFLRRSSGTL